jgi:hypothetical protein
MSSWRDGGAVGRATAADLAELGERVPGLDGLA